MQDLLQLLLDTMPEGYCLHVDTLGDDLVLTKEKPEDVLKLANNQNQVHFVVMSSRPGASEFVVSLEHRFYSPDDVQQNDKFQFRWIRWQDILWNIVSVPREDEQRVVAMAGEMGMTINYGIPHILTGQGVHEFPMRTQNVRTIEGLGGKAKYGNGK